MQLTETHKLAAERAIVNIPKSALLLLANHLT
jgi:hypothetical protein